MLDESDKKLFTLQLKQRRHYSIFLIRCLLVSSFIELAVVSIVISDSSAAIISSIANCSIICICTRLVYFKCILCWYSTDPMLARYILIRLVQQETTFSAVAIPSRSVVALPTIWVPYSANDQCPY